MSRTYRVRKEWDSNYNTVSFSKQRESTCKPGCEICGKGKYYKKFTDRLKRVAERQWREDEGV